MTENPEKCHFSLPYISHNVHYTKCLLSKNRASSLAFARFGDSVFSFVSLDRTDKILLLLPLFRRVLSTRQNFQRLASWLSQPSTNLSFRIPAAAVFRNTGKSLRSKHAPPFCSPLHCRTAPRRIRWSQSTVPPERPDNLRLPAM